MRILVDMEGAMAPDGTPLHGTASVSGIGEAAKVAAATGAKVILPPKLSGTVAEALMQAYGLQRVSNRVYTFCV